MKSIFNAVSILFFIIGLIFISLLFFTYTSVIMIRLAFLTIVAIVLGMVIYGGVLLFKKDI